MSDRWYARAACSGLPVNLFFPKHKSREFAPLMVCKSCPVKSECLTAALDEEANMPDQHVSGIRGGLVASDRVKLRGNEAA